MVQILASRWCFRSFQSDLYAFVTGAAMTKVWSAHKSNHHKTKSLQLALCMQQDATNGERGLWQVSVSFLSCPLGFCIWKSSYKQWPAKIGPEKNALETEKTRQGMQRMLVSSQGLARCFLATKTMWTLPCRKGKLNSIFSLLRNCESLQDNRNKPPPNRNNRQRNKR